MAIIHINIEAAEDCYEINCEEVRYYQKFSDYCNDVNSSVVNGLYGDSEILVDCTKLYSDNLCTIASNGVYKCMSDGSAICVDSGNVTVVGSTQDCTCS